MHIIVKTWKLKKMQMLILIFLMHYINYVFYFSVNVLESIMIFSVNISIPD